MKLLPKKIKIGPFTYEILRDKSKLTAPDARKLADDEALGLTDRLKQQIYVSRGLAREIEKETALHEAFHVMFFNAGLYQLLGYNKEERLVNALSIATMQLLQDNPSFVQYLLDKE